MTLLRAGEVLQGTRFQLKKELLGKEYSRSSTHPETITYPYLPYIELTSSDVTRWKMASRHLERFFWVNTELKSSDDWMFQRRFGDWPDVRRILEFSIALGFSVAASIYGGLHALAWSAHFDSPKEQLLWRMSACVVMGGFPICYIIYGLAIYCDQQQLKERPRTEPWKIYHRKHMKEDFWFRVMDKVFPFLRTVAWVLLCLIPPAYILARAYLVVESFINLSHLPAGVYKLPSWSAYFPHFS